MLLEKIKNFWKFVPFVWRTLILYTPLFAAVFTFFLFLTLNQIELSSIEHTQADILSKYEQLNSDSLDADDFEEIAGDFQIIIFNVRGQPLFEINSFVNENPLTKISQFQSFDNNQTILYNSEIQIFNESYLVQIAKDRRVQHTLISNLKDFFFLIILSGLLISSALAFPLTKFLLKEIGNMAKDAKTISYENLESRLEISGNGDEFDVLAKTLNQMIDRIQVSASSQKKFISNASHELRTPIAIIKGYAQLLTRWGTEDPKILKESALAINNEVESIQVLLEDLLLLTRIDSQLTDLKVQKVDILTLVTESLKENKILYPTREFNLYTDEKAPYEILCDQWLIKSLLRIFTENGVKYSPDNSNIGYSLTKDENFLTLFIVDHGYGIPDEEKSNVFERFYRIDEARTRNTGGSGLGLAIARKIIDLHGSEVKLLDTPNGGTTIKLIFPLYIEEVEP